MKKYAAFIVFCFVILISTGNVFAQPGPGPAGHHGAGGFSGPAGGFNNSSGGYGQPVMKHLPITVNEAKILPHDSWIVLNGNILNMLPGGRQYTFRDTTGEIAVDIGHKEWRGLSVSAADKVEIYGEVKIHRGQLHIKVHAIRAL